MSVDFLSLITTQIILLKNGVPKSTGTGFFYTTPDGDRSNLFLITNVHVLTGHTPGLNEEPLGDAIKIFIHKSKNIPSNIKEIVLPLYNINGMPLWLTSSAYPLADVAAVPITLGLLEGCEEKAVNTVNEPWTRNGSSSMVTEPTTQVSIIGYPHGFYDEINRLPIWKIGSIASEPNQNFNGQPLIIVDASVYRGMSGAPAFAFSNGTYTLQDGMTHVGSTRQLLGVFSAFQTIKNSIPIQTIANSPIYGIIQENSLQLAYIWKISILKNMLKNVNNTQWFAQNNVF